MSTAFHPPPPVSTCPPCAAEWHRLVPLRPALVAYARQRLPDPALAEDLVHDVFEIVITGMARFEGRSTLKSWLVGILKHKIVDVLRRRQTCEWSELEEREDAGEDSLFTVCPQPGPEQLAEHRERLRQTLGQLARLPEPMRVVVERRCLDDEDADEVCGALGITPTHLYVRLHRARRLLAR